MADTSEVDLKRQFEQLQLQQQQKLQRRKEIKQKKESSQSKTLTKEGTSSSFGIDDDLELKTEEPLPKSASYISQELIDHLNEQIRELTDENGRLFKLLSERDYEIRQLKKKREEDRIALTGSSSLSSDSAATKIVELSKKVRELNAALETKRTEAKQLFGRCRHLENELAKNSDILAPNLNTVTSADDVSPRSRTENENEVKKLTDKLRQAEQRNAEYRNQVQGLKTEIRMAQKVINNEIGEGANIQDLLNANSNWRGRAQQILALQKKVGELKQQVEQQPLKSSRSSGGANPDDDLELDFMGATQSKGADMKHREMLRKLEKEKKEQQERATAELRALEADYTTVKQKMEASKARNKVLANENKAFRTEMQKLVDKGLHDDELISALIAQQANMKTMIEQLTAIQKENQKSQQERMSTISAQTQQENNVIQQLKAIVNEKESKVKQLEDELIQLKQVKIEELQNNSVDQLFDRMESPQPNHDIEGQEEAVGVEVRVEEQNLDITTEKGTNRPKSHREIPNDNEVVNRRSASSRPSSGRNSRKTVDIDGRPPTRKLSSRPNSALSKNHATSDELGLQCQEYKSLAQAAQVERDRLMELLQITQKRLDETNEQALSYQTEMKIHKQNAVQLEKLVGKMKLEAPSSKTSAGTQKRKEKTNLGSNTSLGSNTDLRANAIHDSKINEIETALAIQKDENEALKAALESTLKAKEDDLKLYNEMIEQTKLVFLQGLRQFKNKTI